MTSINRKVQVQVRRTSQFLESDWIPVGSFVPEVDAQRFVAKYKNNMSWSYRLVVVTKSRKGILPTL